MSVRKRVLPVSGESRWLVDYVDADGKRRAKQFHTKKEAVAYETIVRSELMTGTHIAEAATTTVQAAKELLIATLEADGAAPSTLENYENYYRNHVAPYVGGRLLTRITPADVQDWLDRLRKDGRTADTIRRARNVLAAVIDEALRRRLVAGNPVRALHPRRRVRRALIEERAERDSIVIPEREDVRKMLDAAEHGRHGWLIVTEPCDAGTRTVEVIEFPSADKPVVRLRAAREAHADHPERVVALFRPARWLRPLLATLALSGIRIGEARGLVWGDVGDGEMTIRRAADRFNNLGPVKTVAALRTVPLGPILAETLRQWRASVGVARGGAEPGDDELVFPSETGDVLTYSNIVNREVSPLQVALGIVDASGRSSFTPHDFRHFAVSLWIDQGADPKQVARWVGHESAAFTLDVYAHLFAKKRDDRGHIEAAEWSVMGDMMQHGRNTG